MVKVAHTRLSRKGIMLVGTNFTPYAEHVQGNQRLNILSWRMKIPWPFYCY